MLPPMLSSARRWMAACVLLGCGLAAGFAAPAAPIPANPAGFVIRRGTNLSHWLSQDFGWQPRRQWITAQDFPYIARLGFDHVRFPVDEKELWGEDGRPNEDAFQLLLDGIGWARAAGLRVILDLHTVRTHHFNAANEGGHNTLFTDPKAQESFLGLWRQLSARLHDQPVDALAYEIMNEPVADNPADWNQLVAAAHRVLRQLEPNRVLVIGSNRWQTAGTFPDLVVPAGDRNIILSVHTYSPMMLTHYRAGWVPIRDFRGPVNYPGPIVTAADQAKLAQDPETKGMVADARDNWGEARLTAVLEPAIRRARELGLQLYCGEFGCLPTVPRAARLAYYRDMMAVFDAHGMGWANWEYKGDFGLFEWHGPKQPLGAPDTGLVDVLLPRSAR